MSLAERAATSLLKYKEVMKGKYEELYIVDFEVDTNPPANVVTRPETQVLLYHQVRPFAANLNSSMHGGAIATVSNLAADIVATAFDKKNRVHPHTIETQNSYHRPIDLNTKIGILVEIEKASKRLFSARISVLDSTGTILVTGRTLKYFESEKL